MNLQAVNETNWKSIKMSRTDDLLDELETNNLDRTKEKIVAEINKLVTEQIQPAVAQHGGEIRLIDYDMESGYAQMLLSGSCSGCASSSATLKMGVENMLRHYIPEVRGVTGVDDPNFNNPYYTHDDGMQ